MALDNQSEVLNNDVIYGGEPASYYVADGETTYELTSIYGGEPLVLNPEEPAAVARTMVVIIA